MFEVDRVRLVFKEIGIFIFSNLPEVRRKKSIPYHHRGAVIAFNLFPTVHPRRRVKRATINGVS